MHFISEQLENYVANASADEPALLKKLSLETHRKTLKPRMLSGHFQGRVLSMLSKIIAPKTILEIGTFTGYATLCLAEGLSKDGILHTIDNNEELVDMQQQFFSESVYAQQIRTHLGNALEVIPALNTHFDLVFIDADKQNYLNYWEMIVPMMNPGGIILSDNVLWSGKVLEEVKANDHSTKALLAFNERAKSDERVETVLLPIRDGLTVSRVKPIII